MTTLNIKTFLIAFFIFAITDILWLGFIARSLYFEQYGDWLRLSQGQLQTVWWAALIVYLLFATSVVVFIQPLAQGSLLYTGIYGALFGCVVYGIYDFTTLAVFKNWPVGMAFVDWIWGIFLYSWGSVITIWIQSHIK